MHLGLRTAKHKTRVAAWGIQACTEDRTVPQIIRQRKLPATAALTLQLQCNTWHIAAVKFCSRLASRWNSWMMMIMMMISQWQRLGCIQGVKNVRPQARARGGHLHPPWTCWKVFFCCNVVVWNLSRRGIYASFWENVVSFWGHAPRPPPGSCPWTLLGEFRPSDPLIAHPW